MKLIDEKCMKNMEEFNMTAREFCNQMDRIANGSNQRLMGDADSGFWYVDTDRIKPYNRVNQNKLDRSLEIKKVVFNPPATIILWADHTKTVVKCQDGDEFDPEKGMAMAFMKKARGNTGGYFKEIDKWAGEYTRKTNELNHKANSLFNVELTKRQLKNLKSVLGVKLDAYVHKPTLKNMAVQFIDEKSESDE